ncbi:uncharacterized protein LOC8289349 [Ricinus communis]|uniref:EGF-like domain-containing protein n=1 Tax=Ricinus communis TaxID=3988 RepID=B9REQ5_RICCO|nr:uncharacterized protein LOC8289349 [Ricinus communis]EEF49676.1 conserved hypothetical protein [Ricinus communis]|eukprot:XP_002512224.1 uncharacterized protein LOC8289349 [Ricinus communis]
MAIVKKFCFLALFLVLLPTIALGDNRSTPILDAICNEVECGKGTCKGDILKPLGYVCECESGWARSPDADVNDTLQFLPCVYPKCTLNYDGCQPAPPTPPEKTVPLNSSFYDPCYWMFCGEGTCTKNSTYNHLCTCKSGFSNLLDVPYFPCYSPCTIGSDCASLGIKVSNSESSPGTNPASSILPGKFRWMIIVLVSILMVLRK